MYLSRAAALAFLVSTALLVAGRGYAATISGTYNFTGGRFTVAPKDPVTGAVTVTFDTAKNYSESTTGVAFTSPDLFLASPLAFTYVPAADMLTVGGTAASVFTSDPNSADFALSVTAASTAPALGSFSYSAGTGAAYLATEGSVTFAASVPEPASALLVGMGLTGLGLLRRRTPRQA